MTEVRVKRTELPSPTLDEPERRVVHIQYTAGELPPRSIYIPKKDWTKELEAERIKADMKARAAIKEETVEI